MSDVRRWEVTPIRLLCQEKPVLFAKRCLHAEPVTVESVLGEHVAWLCPDCDTQFPPEWRP